MLLWSLIAIHVVTALAGTVHVLYYYRRPAAAVAWIFAMLFLPLVGPGLYLTLAVYQGPRTLRRRRRAAGQLRAGRGTDGEREDGYGESLDRAGFPRLMRGICSFPLTAGNRVELLEDDRVAFERQLAAIRSARREVVLETYVLKPGGVQERLCDALAAIADSGVNVRVLIDPIGSHELPWRLLERIESPRLRAATFLAPNPLKGRFQINFRNHRKILCIDGRVAYTGGRNWSDEYYSEFAGETFRDTTFEVEGPVVAGMRRVFLEDWAAATGSGLDPDASVPVPGPCGDRHARVIPSGRDEPTDDITQVLAAAFRAAREHIVIVTPYFVPGPRLWHDLVTAARSGVRVTLLIPRRSGEAMVDLASRYYVSGLLEAGVEVHLREGRVLHSKAVLVDGIWSTVGSANLDFRSLDLNYELNLEVPGREFASALRSYFDADLREATQIDPRRFAARGVLPRICEKAAALFGPVL